MRDVKGNRTLDFHLDQVLQCNRRFENVFQSLSRMIIDGGVSSVDLLGRKTYDYSIFRQENRKGKSMIGMFNELHGLVEFIRDAESGGSASEMALVFIGEPGNGKTFLVNYICNTYRSFLSQPGNERFSFKFVNLDQLGAYSSLKEASSQTFEDPLVLAMNMFGYTEEQRNIEFLESLGFREDQIESFFVNYRALGACSDYILEQIREHTDGDVREMLKFIEVFPVPLSPTRGTVTGKYAAGDKITSSKTELVGESDIQKSLLIGDFANPFRFDVQKGALARVGGGGIHFADELFKNKPDLIQVYLGVIQERQIELDGYIWPLDTIIIATSNNDEFNNFKADGVQKPIIDRCRPIWMPHNTNYQLQRKLTAYVIGQERRKTVGGDSLHYDPNLVEAFSIATVLTRLPRLDKLTPIDQMKLAAGEVAGEHSLQKLAEAIGDLSENPNVKERFGHKGLGQRDVGRAFQNLVALYETNEGKCACALDAFDALRRVVFDEVEGKKDRKKYLEDIDAAKEYFRKVIKKFIFDAYRQKKDAIKKDVSNYVNMVIALGDKDIKPGELHTYRNIATGEVNVMKIETKYAESVEKRMGLKTEEDREKFRTKVRTIYAQKLQLGEEYDYMDQHTLVEAVTEVRLSSDVNNAGSLIGALANRTKEENQQLYDRMIDTMTQKLDFCPSCSERNLEYYCEKDDES